MVNKTRAVVLPAYNDNLLRAMLSLKLADRELPPLKKDEVLVKMEGASCNPSDIAFLRGGYNIVKPLPAVPGFEGAGTVVLTGDDAGEMLGKRVSCFVQESGDGTWAEHFMARKKDCIELREGIDWMQAACLSINPMTALAMFEMAEKAGCRAIIQNAAGGQVPQIIRNLADRKGIKVINLVRKKAQVEALEANGCEFVVDTSAENYSECLNQFCSDLAPTLAFDAVGGPLAGKMLSAMPDGSGLVVYGALSGEPIADIDPMGVIFRRKYVTGFNLYEWIADRSEAELRSIKDEIQDLVLEGVISTTVQATFPLERAVEGLRAYIKSMSGGKIVFTP